MTDKGPDDRSFEKPRCLLVGGDGNVFAVIGSVRRALVRAGRPDLADEFMRRAFAASSYDDVLVLTFEYVQVR